MLLFTLLNTDAFWLWFDICRFQQDDGYNTNMLELYSLLHTAVLLIFKPVKKQRKQYLNDLHRRFKTDEYCINISERFSLAI